MSAITSTSYSFGALDWNIDRETSNILAAIVKWVNYIGITYEFTVLIFFIRSFFDKNSQFRTPYFCCYTIGCFLDFANKFFVILLSTNQVNFLKYPSSVFGWYNKNFMTLWILLLSINRFTAVIFSLDFNQIWTKRRCTRIGILMLLYPFITHCYNPVNIWCNVFAPNTCPITLNTAETEFERLYLITSNITFSFAGTVLGIIASIYMFIRKSLRSQMPEKILLVQSLVSALLLFLYSVSMWLLSQNGFPPGITKGAEYSRILILQSFLSNLGSFFYNIHHYASIILLFITSYSFRTGYLSLFKVPKKYHCAKKQITQTPVKPFTVQPESKTNMIKQIWDKFHK